MNGEESEPKHISECAKEALRELQRPPLVKVDEHDTLTFHDAPGYELDARDFDTHRGLLDWLWHLATSKRWFTMECLLDLLATLIGRHRRRSAAQNGKRK